MESQDHSDIKELKASLECAIQQIMDSSVSAVLANSKDIAYYLEEGIMKGKEEKTHEGH